MPMQLQKYNLKTGTINKSSFLVATRTNNNQ